MMREKINAALVTATKAQDKRRMCTLRLINAAIKDRDIAARGAGKDALTDEDVLEILSKMVKQRKESARAYEDGGRLELVDQELEEIEIIREFMPQQLDDESMRSVCAEVVEDLDAHGLRDMGRTMAALKERYPGQMDFGEASKLVRELLQ